MSSVTIGLFWVFEHPEIWGKNLTHKNLGLRLSYFVGHSGAQPWPPDCPKVKIKNGRLASLASNPLVSVPILELWAKIG